MKSDYVGGKIVFQGQRFRVRVRWCYLVMDAVAWANAITKTEEENEADALNDNDLEFAQMARETVDSLEEWLRDYQPISLAKCPHTEFLLRSIVPPTQVSEGNFGMYMDHLLERCDDAQEEEKIQFYFYADKKALIWLDEKMPRPLRCSGHYVQVVHPGFSGASSRKHRLKNKRIL